MSNNRLEKVKKFPKNLKGLKIENCGISDDNIVDIVSGTLETLSLSQNPITNGIIKILCRHEKLLHLSIYGTNICDDGFSHLNNFNLVYLDLGKTTLTDKSASHFQNFHNLETLNLEDSLITNNALEHIFLLKKIKKLNLSGTQIKGDIKKITFLKELEELDLGFTSIFNDAVKHLSTMSNLKYLNISNTLIDKDNIDDLKEQLPCCYIVY